MSNDTTQKLPGGPSFEERVFARFDAIDARFDAIDARLQALEDQGHQFDERLHTLETQAEQRALETRPISERALAEILEVKENVADLDRKFSVITEDIILRSDQVRLDRRLDRLEPKPTN